MSTGIIIQARRSSKRLPDKILMELPAKSGVSLLGRVIERVKPACDKIIVATSSNQDDDITEQEALKYGALVYRGDLDDVLLRYINAAKKYNIDEIVRITADCPCIDADIIKKVIDLKRKTNSDYASNIEPRSFAHGMDIEVVSLDALLRTDKEEKDIRVREHVTWYIRQSNSFNKVNLEDTANYSDIRVTVDTIEDYSLLNLIYLLLGNNFTYSDIINLYKDNSWLKTLNNNIYQKYVFKNGQEELKEAVKLLELNSMNRAKAIIEKNL